VAGERLVRRQDLERALVVVRTDQKERQ